MKKENICSIIGFSCGVLVSMILSLSFIIEAVINKNNNYTDGTPFYLEKVLSDLLN